MKTMMNKFTVIAMVATGVLCLNSCIQETQPTDVLTSEQVGNMASSQEGLLNGIVSYMVTYNSFGTTSTPINDWGYPCQMMFREVQGYDFPVYSSNYSYWYAIEAGTETRYIPYYTYKYYYNQIKCSNNLIGVVDTTTMTTASKQYLGVAYAYRALCYLDMARMYEFKKTGVSALDAKATSNDIWGLTVPIVTPEMTTEQLKNNPRAPFYTMYRFILSDLNKAERYLKGYSPSSKTLPDLSVVQGLKARLYLELATRFNADAYFNANFDAASDLQKMIESESNTEITYDKFGLTTAKQYYEQAEKYAEAALAKYSQPTTAQQWLNGETGFNTPTDAWMWDASVSTKEQLGYYYCCFPGTVSTEGDWSMARGYKAYRMIGSSLYSNISDDDWRKWSWIGPNDAKTASGYAKYSNVTITKYNDNGDVSSATNISHPSLLTESEWVELPAYANTKFRPAKGTSTGKTDWEIGCLVDLPLMRMEEMQFIKFECEAFTKSVQTAVDDMKAWVNQYRYTRNSYTCGNASTLKDFINQLMLQKRIEFWGEGINYFDFKRLHQQIRRTDNTNYEENFRLDTYDGYVAPWMNYYILEYETSINTAVKPNPDTSKAITVSSSN